MCLFSILGLFDGIQFFYCNYIEFSAYKWSKLRCAESGHGLQCLLVYVSLKDWLLFIILKGACSD